MWTRTHLITIRACAGDPGPDSTHGFIKMTVLSCWWSPPANKGWRDPRVSESPVQNQLALFLDLSSLCLLLGEYWCVYVWVCDGLNPITNSFYGGNFLQGDSIRPLYIEAKCTDVTVKEISNSAHTHTQCSAATHRYSRQDANHQTLSACQARSFAAEWIRQSVGVAQSTAIQILWCILASVTREGV